MIQNAFNSIGQDEPYAISSPEYTIMACIGYDGFVPEPETGAMMLLGFTGLAYAGYRRRGAFARPESTHAPIEI